MKKGKILIAILILAAIAGGIYYAATRRPAEIILTGIVTTDEVIVSSEIQGRLQQLSVKEGDAVTNGELLGVIQPQEQEANAAFYTSSEQQSTADLAQAQADLENARLNFERIQGLYSNNVESVQTYDQARTAYDSAAARVESVKKQIQAAAAQKEKAEVQLGYTRIFAPINGIVDTRAALQGEVVNPGQAIVTLSTRTISGCAPMSRKPTSTAFISATSCRCAALRRDARRHGVLSRRGCRLRHAARRQPHASATSRPLKSACAATTRDRAWRWA